MFVAVLAVFSPFAAIAFAAEQAGAPRLLQEWVPWVLHGQEQKTCTLRSDDGSRRYCSWPSRLAVEVSASGAAFRQEWLIETKTLVPLPGSRKLWPDSVKDGATSIAVIDHNGIPSLWLDRGSHTISGRLTWQQAPEYIDIPPASGLVAVQSALAAMESPHLDKEGKLWLKDRSEKKTGELDQASIQVFRKLQDSIPFLEDIHILLTVSGAPREICLGWMIKDGLLPLQITSPVPARLDPEGRLCVQARPGQWQIDLVVRDTSFKPPEKLTIGAIDGIWPDSEIWVFEAAPKFRQVTIENVPSIDPSRTALPAPWLNLPAYLITRQDAMTLTEKSRGNPQTTPDRLVISRVLWLDQQGTGLTAQDTISGTMTKGWRLNTVPEQHLGKADVEGESQLITRLSDSGPAGIEVRKGNISLVADSRIEQQVRGVVLSFPALGWDHPFQQLTAQLNLPPGWKLLASSGVDKVPSWLTRWTLLDIFLVVIMSLATGRILGWGWGAISLLGLILMYHQPQAPRHLWLPLLALLAVSPKVTSPKAMLCIRIPCCVILVLLLLQSVPFMIREARTGIYPQLEMGASFEVATAARTGAVTTMAPAAPQALQGEAYSLQEHGAQDSSAAPPAGGHRMAPAPRAVSKALSDRVDKDMQIDPQAMIQTGPGLPNWRWQSLPLTWNGPVAPDQTVRLILISPALNCTLNFLRIGLLTLMLVGFFRSSRPLFPARQHPAGGRGWRTLFLALVLCLAASQPPLSAADIPSPEMLQELQNRLLAPPDCKGECASLDNCLFSVQGDTLRLDMTIHALAETAVPLPGDSQTFSQILLDNAPATGIRGDAGTLLLRLPPGIHRVTMEKSVKAADEVNLSFPLSPHHALTKLTDWTITGIHPDGTMEKQVTLKRTVTAQPGAREQAGQQPIGNDFKIPPFFQVERTLRLGLKWTVDTRIVRLSAGNIITAEVPLLPGEMPTSESLYITDRKVQINMGPQSTSFSWQSVLPPADSLTLAAPKTSGWAETWYLDVSPIWHVSATGIPEVSQTNPAGLRYPEYHPHPGESVTLAISRPEGIAGPTMTIDSSTLHIGPGIRETDVRLIFAVRASRGTRHSITLPEGAELQKTLVNDKEYPLQPNGSQLTLPIQPGRQQIEIDWRTKSGVTNRINTPRVDLGTASVNATIQVDVPSSRWILMAGGPRVGPAVLFWGEILVILLLALLLGRIRLTPLTSTQWLLLGLGLSQVHVVFGAMVAGWLLLMGVRKEKGAAIAHDSTFNLFQIALAFATVCACFSLIFAVQQGLLGHPEMQIGGNGSYNHSLHWYQDRNERILPQAWVLSVPLLFYRALMLAWALWLALALLRWLNWGWGCFTDGGAWRKKIRPADTPPDTLDVDIELKEPLPVPQTPAEAPPQKKSWFKRFRKKGTTPPADHGNKQ